jgi:hypothetical protein
MESEFVTNCTGRHGHTVHLIHPPWVGAGANLRRRSRTASQSGDTRRRSAGGQRAVASGEVVHPDRRLR